MRAFASAVVVVFAAAISAEATPADSANGTRSLQAAPQCLAPESRYDYTGNDLSELLTTRAGCCSACSSSPDCNAYTWTKYQGGSCYLKTKKTESEFKDTDYFVYGEVYKCQPVQANRDLAGVDLAEVLGSRPESCCAECRQTTGCSGFAWNGKDGGTCYLKTGPVLRVALANVYSAVL